MRPTSIAETFGDGRIIDVTLSAVPKPECGWAFAFVFAVTGRLCSSSQRLGYAAVVGISAALSTFRWAGLSGLCGPCWLFCRAHRRLRRRIGARIGCAVDLSAAPHAASPRKTPPGLEGSKGMRALAGAWGVLV